MLLSKSFKTFTNVAMLALLASPLQLCGQELVPISKRSGALGVPGFQSSLGLSGPGNLNPGNSNAGGSTAAGSIASPGSRRNVQFQSSPTESRFGSGGDPYSQNLRPLPALDTTPVGTSQPALNGNTFRAGPNGSALRGTALSNTTLPNTTMPNSRPPSSASFGQQSIGSRPFANSPAPQQPSSQPQTSQPQTTQWRTLPAPNQPSLTGAQQRFAPANSQMLPAPIVPTDPNAGSAVQRFIGQPLQQFRSQLAAPGQMPNMQGVNSGVSLQPSGQALGGSRFPTVPRDMGAASSDGVAAPSGQFDAGSLLSTQMPAATNGSETIMQRFPDSKVEIARQVTLDPKGNYVNHGVWKQFQRNGQLVSAGTYQMGQRNGQWIQWHFASSTPSLGEAPYTEFKGPFLSRAFFRDGKLEGPWNIFDRDQRPVSEIHFSNGQRHGNATWFYPEGGKRREVSYETGQINGYFREWNKEQKLTQEVVFQTGRPLLREEKWYDRKKGQREVEQHFLGRTIVRQSPDDWQELKLATYDAEGEQEKHGMETIWYANGQMRMRGQFQNGKPVGQFLWWHENGLKQLSGTYKDGEQIGNWVWWHDNGIKSVEGVYDRDASVGMWTWWDAEGGVSRRQDYSVRDMEEDLVPQESIADIDPPTAAPQGDMSEADSESEGGIPLLRARPISSKRN